MGELFKVGADVDVMVCVKVGRGVDVSVGIKVSVWVGRGVMVFVCVAEDVGVSDDVEVAVCVVVGTDVLVGFEVWVGISTVSDGVKDGKGVATIGSSVIAVLVIGRVVVGVGGFS